MSRKYKKINLTSIVRLKSKELAYFLGVMATDGCISSVDRGDGVRRSERLTIFVQGKDRKWVEKVLRLVSSEYPITKREIAGNYYYGFTITQPGLVDAFAIHGITAKKSLTLQFPSEMSSKLLPHFIRGCFDGDGSVSFKYNEKHQQYVQSVKIISGSEDFLKGISKELTTRNINHSIKVEYRKPEKEDLYRLYIMVDSYEAFYNYMYQGAGTYLCRKRSLYKKLLTYRSKYKNGVQARAKRLNRILTEEYFESNRNTDNDKIPVTLIAKRLKVHKTTVYSHLKRLSIKP